MATKRFRAGAWQYVIKRAGLLPKPIYMTFADEAEGDDYVRRIEALLDKGIVPDEFFEKREVETTLRDAIRRYLQAEPVANEDVDRLAILSRELPWDLALSDLTFGWAATWLTSLKREHNLSPSTIRKRVGALARCLDWVHKSGEIISNPLRMLSRGYATYNREDIASVVANDGRAKEDTERDRRLEGGTEGEEAAIRAVLAGAKPQGKQRALELRHAEYLSLLFDMALESAMRMREMYTLSVDQVDLGKRTIFLDKTKNGDKRQVPLSSKLLQLLKDRLKGRHSGELLFPWWDGDISRRALSRTTSLLSRQFSRVFEAAGCPDLTFHDLRHEATSRLFEKTKLSDLQIAKITGHKDPRVLKRYANLRGSDLADFLW